MKNIIESYAATRKLTTALCVNMKTEDYGLQPAAWASPPKWHLAHTTWFWETFVLKGHVFDYKKFNGSYNFFFNSYYNNVGDRSPRVARGLLSRPTVEEVYDYRNYVDEQMLTLLSSKGTELKTLTELGIQHEQQHQELLLTDIKYALSLNKLHPNLLDIGENTLPKNAEKKWMHVEAGLYTIGAEGSSFSFDNEGPQHQVYLRDFSICSELVTNGEYLEFVNQGGYSDFRPWHSDGWAWVQQDHLQHPLYWQKNNNDDNNGWYVYTLNGLQPLDLAASVTHISLYEAFAFAEWAGYRLPTEQEWEVASNLFSWGARWEWTLSAYLPYPGYQHASGALGEYNGKFMINQMVLRGASLATAPSHSRPTYRNFFSPDARWQFTGLRLSKKHD